MTPGQEQALFERLREVAEAPKSFDARTDWKIIPQNRGWGLSFVVGLRLGGILRSVSGRFETPKASWESNVYGQLDVVDPAATRPLRLLAAEWKPIRPHDNRGDGPEEHRFRTLYDRYHPLELNLQFGIGVFLQKVRGIALPINDAETFEEYLNFCAELWNCPDVRSVPKPEWSRDLV